MSSEYLLEVKNLTKRFPIKGGLWGKEVGSVKAVNDISFRIKKGRDSPCWGKWLCKTTLGRSILKTY